MHAIRYLNLKKKNSNMTNKENIHRSTGKTLIDMINSIKGIYKDHMGRLKYYGKLVR